MFIVNITYKVPLEDVDQHLEAHIAFLNRQYELGTFLASGRKVPRTGGIILAKSENTNALLEVLETDPFKSEGLADYEVIQRSGDNDAPSEEVWQ